MPSEVSLKLKRVHEIAFYRQRADELRGSARGLLEIYLWPFLWALAKAALTWPTFLKSAPMRGPCSA
jgi:hypothetical protein